MLTVERANIKKKEAGNGPFKKGMKKLAWNKPS